MPTNYGTAASQANLMFQKINEKIEKVQNLEKVTDSLFMTTKPDDIGIQDYRIPFQIETGTQVGAVNLDGGAYFQGTGPQYPQGIMAPFAILGAATATELSQMVSKGGPDVVVNNYVNRMIVDMKRKVAHFRNSILQGSNTGQIATVDASYTSGTTVQLKATPFGGRLIDIGMQLQDFDGSNNLRGTFNVIDVSKNSVGAVDTMTIDAAPSGMAASDGIFVLGVASGTPLFFNGLQYILSSSSSGEYLGVDRGNSWVQVPAYNANSAYLTLGAVQAMLTRGQQALGIDRFMMERKKNCWLGHPAQWFSSQVLGFAKQMNVLDMGKASTYDGVPNPMDGWTLAGFDYKPDTTAATTILYWADPSVLCRIRYPNSERMLPGLRNGIFWPRQSGGLYLSQDDIYYIDSVNYASLNNWAHALIYNLGVQAALTV